jgi:1,4-alpha-glucan branching enzyme
MVTVDNGFAEFLFYRPDAKAVFICGEFNDWRHDQCQMTPKANGYWFARIKLPAGDYKFRYFADGQWFTDYAAFGVEPGKFGLDSVLHVPQPMLTVAPQRQAVAAA